MPIIINTASYQYTIGLSGAPGVGVTAVSQGVTAAPYEMYDDVGGNVNAGDGSEASGEALQFWDDDAGDYVDATYTGYMVDGQPVVKVGSAYILMSTTPLTSYSGPLTFTAGDFLYCFARGTRVATPEGERTVESLALGDQVLNAQGQAVAVKWVGRQTRHPAFAKLTDKMPICIQQGALGGGLPLRDLFVSPDHAMLVDGVLAHAGALVNGRTITQVQTWEGDVEYFHIETEAHELVLAEGAAAETFIDNVSRKEFDNYAEFEALYPNAQPMVEMELPRVKFARQLPRAISRRLEAVADELLGKQAVAA